MHGFTNGRRSAGQHRYQRRGRHLRDGQCAAASRADTAARILLGLPVSAGSLAIAARMCGSNVAYVAAAVVLIQAEDASLSTRVRRGHVPLLEAAESVKSRAALIKAFRKAAPADLAALSRTVGVDRVFDSVIAPALV
jgi:hypothetical protein